MIGYSGLYGRRNAQRFMNAGKIVVHEAQRKVAFEVFNFLAESIR